MQYRKPQVVNTYVAALSIQGVDKSDQPNLDSQTQAIGATPGAYSGDE